MIDHVRAGGCLCGAVRYEIAGEPAFVMQCCCRQCQRATGTGHTTFLAVHQDHFQCTGDVASHVGTGGSGGAVLRHFCPVCGSRLYTSGEMAGPLRLVQAGTLDDPDSIAPTAAVHTGERVSWDALAPDVVRHERMP